MAAAARAPAALLAEAPTGSSLASADDGGATGVPGYPESFDGIDVPSAPQAVRIEQRISRGRFVSVQVNVNDRGLNTAGDAANEPSIAVDPTDTSHIVIGWRQFRTVNNSALRKAGWAYSRDGGASWTFPGVLDQFPRSDPVLDADAQGNIYYYSLTGGLRPDGTIGAFCDLFVSRDRGLSWEPPVHAFGEDKPWMVVDRAGGRGSGNIYASWNTGDFSRSIDGGRTFLEPIALPQRPYFGTLSVGPAGELYVVGMSAVGFVVDKSTNVDDPSATPLFTAGPVDLGGTAGHGGPNPGGLLGQPWIATDHSESVRRGNVYVLASVDPPGPDPLDVMFTRSTDEGVTWSAPLRVNDDEVGGWQWFGTMSVAPNGRIDVIWNDTRNDPSASFSEVYHAWSIDGGTTWSANEPVSPPFDHSLGYPAQTPGDPATQNKLGDYYHMVSDNGGADLAYAATFNGEQDVYFVRIAADCNGNGIDDACDIACGLPGGRCDVADCGTARDCNGNEIPDECEVDVGGDGTIDDCARTPTHTATRTPQPSATATSTAVPTASQTPGSPPTHTATQTPVRPPTHTPTPAIAICSGDCDCSGGVTIDEILTLVGLALVDAPGSQCPAGDANRDGWITVDEILVAVNNARTGCSETPAPHP
jgi:hypothetical protein